MCRVASFAALPILIGWAAVAPTGAAEKHDDGQPWLARANAPAGSGSFAAGAWGAVAIDLVNPTSSPVELLAAAYFAGQPNLQYARRLWTPARTKRSAWQLALPPSDLSGKRQCEITTLLYRAELPDAPLANPSGGLFYSGLLALQNGATTAVICDPAASQGEGKNGESIDEAMEAVVALRLAAQLSRRVLVLDQDPLPPAAESLQTVQQFVVCSDRLASDAAALTAVRRWLCAGGRLWLMLDRIEPSTAALLLGESLPFEVLDRVGLTDVRIEDAAARQGREGAPAQRFERPVDLVRVLASGVDVTHTVNGWPASFWRSVGRGRVLFTTLGPRGWIRPRTAQDPQPDNAQYASSYVAAAALESLAQPLFAEVEADAPPPEAFKPLLLEEIGYRILPRWQVALVLAGFCSVLLGAGVWLARRGRLERLGWAGPVAALLAAAILAAMGARNKQVVPPTVAMLQTVEVEPFADEGRAAGLLAVYRQRPSDSPIGARRGGVFFPELSHSGGVRRRMVWTDLDEWAWEGLSLPAGVCTAAFERATPIDPPIAARGRFGADGLTIQLSPGPLGEVEDVVVSLPSGGNLAARLDQQGCFRAGPDDVLAPDQFIQGGLLSDRQRRRQLAYRQWLGGERRVNRPMFLGWAKPLDMAFTLPRDVEHIGSALLVSPLVLERTPGGAYVAIPSPLLEYRSVSGPGRTVVAPTYNHRTGRWLGSQRSATLTWLRFAFPDVVLPFKVESARLTLQINAPSRELRVVGWTGDEEVVLGSRGSASGRLQFPIDRADVLGLDESGGLLLGLFIGAAQSRDLANEWRIDRLELGAAGRTLER